MKFTFYKFSLSLLVVLAVAGCGAISLPKIESDKIDYKSAQQLPPLEVPPDLAAPATDDRYAIPGAPGTAPADSAAATSPVTLIKGDAGNSMLSVKDSFDRAWRRVGLAIDRSGINIEDRDRSKGIYRVRYADAEAPKDEGFFSKWLSLGKTSKPEDKHYQILVTEKEGGSTVSVLGADGNLDKSEAASRMLALLYEQMK
jgi:outer membrane protein assembly factor BamC